MRDIEREMLVMALLDSGLKGTAVARELGVSKQRVSQVKVRYEPSQRCRCGALLRQGRVMAGECLGCGQDQRLACAAEALRSWRCSTPGCEGKKARYATACARCYFRGLYRRSPERRAQHKMLMAAYRRRVQAVVR